MQRIVKVLSLAVFLLSLQAVAADKAPEWKPLELPKEIATKQEIVTTPAGWTCAKEAHPNVLSSVSISEGPPEDQATLVYDDETKNMGKIVATWKFDADSKERYWISCRYSGTDIMVKKALPEGVRELRIFYDDGVKTDGMPTVEKIEYR